MARILVLSPFEPPPDGIGRHTALLVEAWDSAGHHALVLSPGNHRSVKGASRIGSRSRVARILRWRPRRSDWKEIVEFQPDVVVVQFALAAVSTSFWPVVSLCKRCAKAGIPVVVIHEPAREYELFRLATAFFYRAMARVTTVPVVFSPAGRLALIENGLFDDVIELPHGTSGVATVTDADIQRVGALYNIQKPLVLTLGFSGFDKGTDLLLDAASEIASTQSNDVQFLIAGAPRKRRGIFRLREYLMSRFSDELSVRLRRSRVSISRSLDLFPTLTWALYFSLPMSLYCPIERSLRAESRTWQHRTDPLLYVPTFPDCGTTSVRPRSMRKSVTPSTSREASRAFSAMQTPPRDSECVNSPPVKLSMAPLRKSLRRFCP